MANLRDLIAATSLPILDSKLDSNHQFFSPCDWNLMSDLKKTIGHLFYTMSSYVHHLIAIGEFKLEVQPGNAKCRSKIAIFLSCVTLKIDGRHWKTIGHLSLETSSFVHHFITICEFKTGVMFYKWLNRVLTFVTLNSDVSPWQFE